MSDNESEALNTAHAHLLESPSFIDAVCRSEWIDDFASSGSSFYAAARKRARHGLKSSQLRSVHWRLFLNLLDQQSIQQWDAQLTQQRQQFEQLIDQYKVDPKDNEENASTQSTNQSTEHATTESGSATPTRSAHKHSKRHNKHAATKPAEKQSDKVLQINNPLSKSESSAWHQYFMTTELSQLIDADLKRTYPESSFFQSEMIQSIMLNILIVWCKIDPSHQYRQGMNELLAPIIIALYVDHRSTNDLIEQSIISAMKDQPSAQPADHSSNLTSNQTILSRLLDRKYVEHDAFHMFSQLMIIMKPYFLKIENTNKPDKLALLANNQSINKLDQDDIVIDETLSPTNNSSQIRTPITDQCQYIFHHLLNQTDPALYKHLVSHKIEPQYFLLRWFRLLFAREFHIEDVLSLWDVLFSQSDEKLMETKHVSLADFFCVAMIVYVKRELMSGDQSACLTRLMRFPPIENLQSLVDRAILFKQQHDEQSKDQSGNELSKAAHHHQEIQKFISEYENGLIDDPVASIKRHGSRAYEAIKSKSKNSTMKSSTPTPSLIQSQSNGSLNGQSTPSVTSPPSSASASDVTINHSLIDSDRPIRPPGEHSNCVLVEEYNQLTGVMQDLSSQLALTLDRLNQAAQQSHRASVNQSSNGQNQSNNQPKLADGEMKPMNSQFEGGFNSALILQSIAELKHIHGVMSGQLPIPINHSNNASRSASPNTPSSANGTFLQSGPSSLSHLFSVPTPRESPKERLQRLLREKEQEAARERARLTQQLKEEEQREREQAAVEEAARRRAQLLEKLNAGNSKSLFDNDSTTRTSASSSALLSTLIGTEKKSVFD